MELTRVTVPAGVGSPDGRITTHLLGSDDAVLIDPGGHDDALAAAVEAVDLGHVLVTHHHPDHAGAVDRFAEGATVWARAGRVDAFSDATGVTPDRTFRPGTTIPTGDGRLRVLDTPGHAPEHVAFGTASGLVCGDLAVAEGSVAIAAPEGDMRAYLTSLRRVHAMAPSVMFPAHGPVIETPRPTLERLIAHRLDRESRVLAAVEDGAATLAAVTGAAYDKDLTGVEGLARATVRAHLEKLDVEGALSWDGDRAQC
jgi:glyoxylase-like metal-dependent hydrolase (beta-lactamase superfamily II)